MKNATNIAAIALVLFGLWRQLGDKVPLSPTPPLAASTHSEEAVALKAALDGHVSASDRAALGDLYLSLAKAVETGKVIKTTEHLMIGTSNAIDLAFNGRPIASGNDVGALVDAVVIHAIGGKPNVPLTDELRQKACHGLREVAWACGRQR